MASSPPSAAAAAANPSFARRCYLKVQQEAVLALYTPFMVCLAAGHLGEEEFQQHDLQGVHIVRAHMLACEIAERHVDDIYAKVKISELRGSLSKELKRWGIDTTNPIPATEKYTKFLMDIAEGNVEAVQGVGNIAAPFEKTKLAACTIAAITSWMMLYACLGQQLKRILKEIHPLVKDVVEGDAYKNWVTIYASEKNQVEATRLEALLDKLSVVLTRQELELVEKIYHHATKLQVEFFSAQPVQRKTAIPLARLHDPADGLIVFSGFDLTCTVLNSSAILAKISIGMAARADDTQDGNSIPRKFSSEMIKSWKAARKQYAEYELLIENVQGDEPYTYETLYNGLEGISNAEKQVNARVFESGLLNGINIEDIERAGEQHIILQDGCADFFRKVAEKKNELNAEVHIISKCWCADLIRTSFSLVGCLSELTIRSNEFTYVNSVSTEDYIRNIESSRDKMEAFENILSKCSSKPKPLSVYIGNDVGDLLCLLKADVGIVIGESVRLRELGKKFGVYFGPLHMGLICKQIMLGENGSSVWKAQGTGMLYTVTTWSEIAAFILGLEA